MNIKMQRRSPDGASYRLTRDDRPIGFVTRRNDERAPYCAHLYHCAHDGRGVFWARTQRDIVRQVADYLTKMDAKTS